MNYQATGNGVVSAGPNLQQARPHLIEGSFGSSSLTLELASPRGEPTAAIYAAAHVESGNPPSPAVNYAIDFSFDAGRSWQPMLKDWTISRRGDEPTDFWSQSFCWGSITNPNAGVPSARVRFRNNGGKNYPRGEVHLVYRDSTIDPLRVTFDWTDDGGPRRESHTFTSADDTATTANVWTIATGRNVRTRWVDFTPRVD